MKTPTYVVVGYPVKHSLSPHIQNTFLKYFKLPGEYLKKEIKPEKLEVFMKTFRENFDGANITIPHKQTIIAFLDVISPDEKKIGAVNTIVNKKGKLFGYNTDAPGAIEALKNAKVSLKGKRAIVLGAGGAARAIIYALKKSGAKVTILNRTLSHAKKLAKDFSCSYGALQNFEKYSPEIIINTTSVGLEKPNESPLPTIAALLKNYKKKPIVMDIVYRPLMTKLLKDAKKAGCKIITGEKMLIAQAALSFKLWTDKNVPKTIFSKIQLR